MPRRSSSSATRSGVGDSARIRVWSAPGSRLNGRPFTVIGVAPEGLASRFLSLQPDVWMPLGLAGDAADARTERLQRRSRRELRVMGRLRDGATLEEVRTQIGVLERRLRSAWPDDWKDEEGHPRRLTAMSERASRIDPANRTLLATIVGFFLVVSALVLLVACTNVMSLFLAEVGRRRREVAVRLALGASRGRVVRLLVLEGLLIGLGRRPDGRPARHRRSPCPRGPADAIRCPLPGRSVGGLAGTCRGVPSGCRREPGLLAGAGAAGIATDGRSRAQARVARYGGSRPEDQPQRDARRRAVRRRRRAADWRGARRAWPANRARSGPGHRSSAYRVDDQAAARRRLA